MKLLILLAGLLALSAAYPLQTEKPELDSFDVDRHFAEEHLTLDEVQKQLKDRFDEVLKKIKDAIDSGKSLKGEFLEKAKELREKLKNLKVNVGDKESDLLDRIREKGKEFFKDLLEKLNFEKRDIHSETELQADEYGDIVRQLKDKFDEVSKKVKDAFEQGKALKEGLDQLQEIRKKLKDLNVDVGGKYQEFLDKLKDKVKDYWNKLKEKLTAKRNSDFEVYALLVYLKDEIRDTFSFDQVKNILETFLGKGSEFAEKVVQSLKEGGQVSKEKLLDLIDAVFNEGQKVQNYFKDLKIELQDRFVKFGKFVKERYDLGQTDGRTEVENVARIAIEMLLDTKEISRDVAEEALDFLRQYRVNLDVLYDETEKNVLSLIKEEA